MPIFVLRKDSNTSPRYLRLPAGSIISNRCFAGNITTSTVANRTLTFTYGPEHQRIMQRTELDATAPASMSQAAGRAYYLNGANNDLGYEKEVKDNGLIEHKHYLSAGGIVFAMQITRSGNTATGGASGNAKASQSLQYLHHDRLGSVAVVTDDTGSVIERLAYDPWGKRRFPNGTADTTDSIVGLTLDRGFTMHEHLDEMGVIHMNGRIYDPLIGRFMSADPFIQAPENLQSHNRFAYVMNNPLGYTDPSGYFSLKKLFKFIIAVVIAIHAPQLFAKYGIVGASPAVAGFVNAAAAGFLAGAVTSGSLKGALQGAFTAGLFHGAGLTGTGADAAASPERYLAHAAAGCVSSVAGGGKCGSGAVSALFGKYTTNWLDGQFGKELSLQRGIAAAVAGGVGAVIGGGKFESGAVTAAFGYMFNACSSGQCGSTPEESGEPTLEKMRLMTREENIEFAKGAAFTVAVAVVGPELAAAAGTSRLMLLLSDAELKMLISGGQTTALREFFGTGLKGAAARAEQFAVPAQLTRDALVAYREVATRAISHYEAIGNQAAIAVQRARIELVNRALK